MMPDEGRTAAIWSLILFVALPLIGLGALEAKFLHGTFYFATDGGFDCSKNCEEEVGVLAHFWPAHGFPDVFDTSYRYAGNLTYVPFVQPIVWLLFGIGALAYAVSYLRLVFGNAVPRALSKTALTTGFPKPAA